MTRKTRSRATSRSEGAPRPLVINGWQIFAHSLLLSQLDHLVLAVEREARKHPGTYRSGANAKVLASLTTWMFQIIPADPTLPAYRQGNTLGGDMRHWFRAKFARQRFRLFFRFRSEEKIIVYAWVNDEKTKRTYGAKSDAYAVFSSMVKGGNPPDDWAARLRSCEPGTDDLTRIAGVIGRFGS